jgi:Cu2+-exporting ATPase
LIHINAGNLASAYAVCMSSASHPAFNFPSATGRIAPPADPALSIEALRLLDDPAEWATFSRPVPDRGDCWVSSVVFEGMHCAACALTIEQALAAVPGVIEVDVGAANHRGRVVWSAAATRPSIWMQAARQAGYAALPANDAGSAERRRREGRRALWRWAVAGMGMMQVMMYTVPVYFAAPGEIVPDQMQLLRWASWVLTLPVILFSCQPFFANAWRDLVQRRVSMDLPVALGILIAFAVSTAATFDPHGLFGAEVWFDSLTMFVFFLLSGRLLEARLADRTAGALDALMNRLPDSVERAVADGRFERVTLRRLVIGDTIRVLPGAAFPADGIVIDGESSVDEALLTGESRPLSRRVGSAVLAGSHNLAAPLLVRVERLGTATRFAHIVALMDSAGAAKPAIARLADRVARPFLFAVLFAAAGAAAWHWQADPGRALMTAAAVLVVTCPCALSLATPMAMLAAAGTLARRGVLVRRLAALEELAGVDTIVFDKTGTLTQDTFRIDDVRPAADTTRADALVWAASLARHSLHPVSRALTAAAGVAAQRLTTQSVEEVAGQGVRGVVMHGDTSLALRLGSARFCGIEPDADGGLHAYLCDDDGVRARFAFEETMRPDAAATVAALAADDVQVYLLSGDGSAAVERCARELAHAGATLNASYGDCTPQKKLEFLRLLQASGRHVAMVGDGLNDGPVLAGANVSFAFGRAVPLAQAHADFVVLGEQLGDVALARALARRTVGVVRQNLAWALAYNLVCVPLAVAGWLPAWLAGLGMAASSLVVVANAARLAPPRRAAHRPAALSSTHPRSA